MGRSELLPDDDMLQIYKTPGDPAAPGKDTDPDWVKNATDIIWTVNKESLSKLEDEITSFFLAHDDINIQGSFNRFHHLVQGEKLNIKNNARGWSTMYNRPMEPDDPQEEHIYDEALQKIGPLTKKYEAGKYTFAGLQKALLFLSGSGSHAWKTNPKERERLEKDAPIIMKFDDGFMWVRLDSQEEFEREGDMLQNCLHGYCPPQEAATGKGTGESRDAVYQAWKDAGKPLNKEALAAEKAGNHILEFWWWGDREEGTDVSEALTPNLRRLMKWVNETKAKLYPDVAAMEPNWFEDDQPFGWKMGVDMEGTTFQKYENVDHYIANHIITYEYLAADPTDPEHEPDEWERNEVPTAMGGSLVYSLRDRNGNSHVAIEYDRHKEKPFQMDVKGKQNDEPDAKYNKYIKALDKHWKEHPEDFGVKIDTPAESVNEGDLIPNPANTVAIKTQSDGDFYNLSKYLGDLDKASKTEFGEPDSAAVITFQDPEMAARTLKRIKKHTGLDGDDVSGYEDPGDAGTWDDEETGNRRWDGPLTRPNFEDKEKSLSLLGHDLKRTPKEIPFEEGDVIQHNFRSNKEDKVEPDLSDNGEYELLSSDPDPAVYDPDGNRGLGTPDTSVLVIRKVSTGEVRYMPGVETPDIADFEDADWEHTEDEKGRPLMRVVDSIQRIKQLAGI
jgi:hypothetical protein